MTQLQLQANRFAAEQALTEANLGVEKKKITSIRSFEVSKRNR